MIDTINKKKFNLVTFGEKPYECIDIDKSVSLSFDEIIKNENTEKFVNDYINLLTSIENYLSMNDIRVDEIAIHGSIRFFCEESNALAIKKVILNADNMFGLTDEEYKSIKSILPLNLVQIDLSVDYNEIGSNLRSDNPSTVEDMWYYGDISSEIREKLPRGKVSGLVDISKMIKLLSENNIDFNINSYSESNHEITDESSLFRFVLDYPEAWPSLHTSYGFILKRKKTK